MKKRLFYYQYEVYNKRDKYLSIDKAEEKTVFSDSVEATIKIENKRFAQNIVYDYRASVEEYNING